jgi:hypothetical protein
VTPEALIPHFPVISDSGCQDAFAHFPSALKRDFSARGRERAENTYHTFQCKAVPEISGPEVGLFLFVLDSFLPPLFGFRVNYYLNKVFYTAEISQISAGCEALCGFFCYFAWESN